MRLSLVSSSTAFGLVLVFSMSGSPVYGQASARQIVSIEVAPILAISISPSTGDRSALHYNLTTNVEGAMLEAALTSSRPVKASLEAETTVGTSSGAVALDSDGKVVPIVTGIVPGVDVNQTITVAVESGAPPDLTLALTLRDPATGSSETVRTQL